MKRTVVCVLLTAIWAPGGRAISQTLVINGKEIQHFSQDEILFPSLPAEIIAVTEAK